MNDRENVSERQQESTERTERLMDYNVGLKDDQYRHGGRIRGLNIKELTHLARLVDMDDAVICIERDIREASEIIEGLPNESRLRAIIKDEKKFLNTLRQKIESVIALRN